ncbi:hypothetical protein [Acinetobacter sp. G11]|uniref:hypothetical protein n=1 Tax=Acinetobacter sp. G11 TaxID=3415989 RepID=UPI003C79BB6F
MAIQMEVDIEEGLEVVKEFDIDELIESEPLQTRTKKESKSGPKFHQGEGVVQEIQKSLQQNVRVVN